MHHRYLYAETTNKDYLEPVPTAVIIDDEFHARENLRLLLQEYGSDFQVLGEASGIESGLTALSTHRPDVVFLDIRMPSGDEGFQLLNALGPSESLVVFVTAFKDYAIEAFKVQAVDYLLKPIDIDELESTLERIRQRDPKEKEAYLSRLHTLTDRLLDKDSRIAIHHGHGIKLVAPEDITYLSAESNCTRLHFKDGTQFLDTRTLGSYEQLLDRASFMRVHRSYIINLHELTGYERQNGPEVSLYGDFYIPVSKSYRATLLDWIQSNSRSIRSVD